MNHKPHRQYVQEQIEQSEEFAREYETAQAEARFAVELSLLREKRGLTQQQVAEAAGIKQPMLARYERGQLPTMPTLLRLAKALDATITFTPEAITIQSAPNRRKPARALTTPRL